MIKALASIGLVVTLLFIFIGIPFIVWIIADIKSNDSEESLFKTFITVNVTLAMVLSAIILTFINNPEKFGYEKIQTEQTTEVNENGED